MVQDIYYQKAIGLNMKKFWISILSLLPALVLPCIYGTTVMLFYNFNGLLDFGLFILGYCVIYLICIYLFGLNKEEKKNISSILKKFKIKRNRQEDVGDKQE